MDAAKQEEAHNSLNVNLWRDFPAVYILSLFTIYFFIFYDIIELRTT